MLLKEAARKLTKEMELIIGDPKFLGWVDASGEGVGGCWISGKYALELTIWRLEWLNKLLARLDTPTKPVGTCI